MLLNLTIACNLVQVECNALQTPTTCLIYIKKFEPNSENSPSVFVLSTPVSRLVEKIAVVPVELTISKLYNSVIITLIETMSLL